MSLHPRRRVRSRKVTKITVTKSEMLREQDSVQLDTDQAARRRPIVYCPAQESFRSRRPRNSGDSDFQLPTPGGKSWKIEVGLKEPSLDPCGAKENVAEWPGWEEGDEREAGRIGKRWYEDVTPDQTSGNALDAGAGEAGGTPGPLPCQWGSQR